MAALSFYTGNCLYGKADERFQGAAEGGFWAAGQDRPGDACQAGEKVSQPGQGGTFYQEAACLCCVAGDWFTGGALFLFAAGVLCTSFCAGVHYAGYFSYPDQYGGYIGAKAMGFLPGICTVTNRICNYLLLLALSIFVLLFTCYTAAIPVITG